VRNGKDLAAPGNQKLQRGERGETVKARCDDLTQSIIALSRELPGVIVVRTDVNSAVSTSIYTPLLIPLEEH